MNIRTRLSCQNAIFWALTALSVLPVAANTSPPVSYAAQDDFIRDKIEEHLDDKLMAIIAGCESTGNPERIKHWNKDGTLVANPTSSARGALQTLLQLHGPDIEALDLDMYDIDDYMTFVQDLHERQGYGAWAPSKHCWGKYQHLAGQ